MQEKLLKQMRLRRRSSTDLHQGRKHGLFRTWSDEFEPTDGIYSKSWKHHETKLADLDIGVTQYSLKCVTTNNKHMNVYLTTGPQGEIIGSGDYYAPRRKSSKRRKPS